MKTQTASTRKTLPFLFAMLPAIFVMSAPAITHAQTAPPLSFTLDPADGVIQSGQTTVTITPNFDPATDRPSEITQLRLLPTSPTVATIGYTYQARRDGGIIVQSRNSVSVQVNAGGGADATDAVFGEDYYLSAGSITLHPDGRISPPTVTLTVLQPYREVEKMAAIGVYFASGDSKYDTAADGETITEIGVIFQDNVNGRSVELYLTTDDTLEGRSPMFTPHPQRGEVVDRFSTVEPRGMVVAYKARVYNRLTGESIAADEEFTLHLGDLPAELALPESARPTITLDTVVFQLPPATLTIASGESEAVSEPFVIYPFLDLPYGALAHDRLIPLEVPTVVDSQGDPATLEAVSADAVAFAPFRRDLGGLIINNNGVITFNPGNFSSAGIPTGQSVVETQLDEYVPLDGAVQVQVNVRDNKSEGTVIISTVDAKVTADDTASAISADSNDFMRLHSDGRVTALPDGDLDFATVFTVFSVDTRTRDGEVHTLHLALRQDGLVEPEETFKVTIDRGHRGSDPHARQRQHPDHTRVVTIAANGSVELEATIGVTALNSQALLNTDVNPYFRSRHQMVEVRGELKLSSGNTGIVLAAEDTNLHYATSEGDLSLRFTDTHDVNGDPNPDGILSGDELIATASYTYRNDCRAGKREVTVTHIDIEVKPSTFSVTTECTNDALAITLQNRPAGFTAEQFPPTMPQIRVVNAVVGFQDSATLTLTENSIEPVCLAPHFNKKRVTTSVELDPDALPDTLAGNFDADNVIRKETGESVDIQNCPNQLPVTVALSINPPLFTSLPDAENPAPQTPETLRIVAVRGAGVTTYTADDVLATQSVNLPWAAEVAEIAVDYLYAQIVDDDFAELDTTFTLLLEDGSAKVDINQDARARDVSVADDGDITTFSVQADPEGMLNIGDTVSLFGRFSRSVSIGGATQLAATSTDGGVTLIFTDANADGMLTGREARSAPSEVEVDFTQREIAFEYAGLAGATVPGEAQFAFPDAPTILRCQFPTCSTPISRYLTAARSALSAVEPVRLVTRDIVLTETDLADAADADARARLNAEVQFFLSADTDADAVITVTAEHDPDGIGGRAPRRVLKSVTIPAAADGTATYSVTFDADDYATLNITDNAQLRQQVAALSLALTIGGRSIGEPLSGPTIVFEDDELLSGARLRVFLADAAGNRIESVEEARRTDAFVRAEITGGDGAPLTSGATLPIIVDLAAGGLSLTELGNPQLPLVMSIPGGSSGGNSRGIRIEPSKTGVFSLAASATVGEDENLSDTLTPGHPSMLINTLTASHPAVSHTVVPAATTPKYLVVFRSIAPTEVTEGGDPMRLRFETLDAATGKRAAITRNGATEAVTLRYTYAAGTAGTFTTADINAVGGSGYDRTITIAAGDTTTDISVELSVDSLVEGNEDFTVTLTAVVDSAGLPLFADGVQIASVGVADSVAHFTLIDGDSTPQTPTGVELIAGPARQTLNESATSGNNTGKITLTRPSGFVGAISGVLLGAPADFTMPQTFTIPAVEQATTVEIAVIADGVTEPDESFNVNVVITKPASGLLPPAPPLVEISDADRPITLRIATDSVAVSGNEGAAIEVTVELVAADDSPAPPRTHPVEFTLTPTISTGTGNAAAADFLVYIDADDSTRPAATAAELTDGGGGGIIEPNETSTTVAFLPVADRAPEGAETMPFALTLTDFGDADLNSANTHDSAISVGTAAITTISINASAAGSPNVLVVTPTTTTREYGAAAPANYAFTVAPQTGSSFIDSDSATTTRFFTTTTPVQIATGTDNATTAAGEYAYVLSTSYQPGIDAKYDFVFAPGAVYTITPKEITFNADAVDKVYDGTILAPGGAFPGNFAANDIINADEVHVFGGIYAGKDVAAAAIINGFGIGGADAGNYTLAAASAVSGNITAREITNLSFVIQDLVLTTPAPYTPEIARDKIGATGVVESELAGFRAALDVSAVYDTQPTVGGDYAVTVTVHAVGNSGNFANTNYVLTQSGETFSAIGFVGDTPGAPTDLAGIYTAAGDAIDLSWRAPDAVGGPGLFIVNYFVRWRTAADGATAAAAGNWQDAAGDSDAGEDVGMTPAYRVTGLTKGVAYEFQAQAANSLGGGEFGEIFAPFIFINLDVDGSGGGADITDGVLITRHIAGLHGDALTAGLNAAGNAIAIAANIEGIRATLDVDGVGGVSVADGIMITRYLLGVTGAALTAGQSGEDAADVEAAIEGL